MDTISPDEAAYQAKLIATLKSAQAAWASWCNHLAEKYQLQADDRISEDGMIHREAPAPVTPPA